MGEGTVFTGVCSHPEGCTYPGAGGGYPTLARRVPTLVGPILARVGSAPPPKPPPRQISTANTCCSTGGMPLGFHAGGTFLYLLCCWLISIYWGIFVAHESCCRILLLLRILFYMLCPLMHDDRSLRNETKDRGMSRDSSLQL